MLDMLAAMVHCRTCIAEDLSLRQLRLESKVGGCGWKRIHVVLMMS
jgi:hypothetical protein